MDGQLHLQIEDDGPGIPPAERSSVLQPFYRGEGGNHAVSCTRGHGLGLAIVERIAQWHQLGLQLEESERLGGLRVSLIWPVSN